MTIRTLYIHIGCHKTGTTSIQHNLAQNAEALGRAGLSFFYEDRRSGELLRPDLHSWLVFNARKKVVPHGMRCADVGRLVERLSEFDNNIVLSSENFSFFFKQTHIDRLQKGLSEIFEKIIIICYLRRQDKHVFSHHQEGSKLFRSAEYDLFGHSTRAIPEYSPNHDLYLDYNTRLSMWGEAFGNENLILKVFDRSALRGGDVVNDFFHILGVEEFNKVHDRNLSLGALETKLGHILNRKGFQNTAALSTMLQHLELTSSKSQPSQTEARAYYEMYADSNIILNSAFNISPDHTLFDESFSDYPEEPQDCWTEDSANEVISALLHLLDDSYASLSVEDLVETALFIGRKKTRTALKLLRFAQKLRPNGPLIARKIAEFEQVEFLGAVPYANDE